MADPILGPIGPAPPWAAFSGAIFGGMTLAGLFVFAFIAGREPDFICNSFTLLAAIFAFGSALAAVFVGGAAGVSGNIPVLRDNVVAFSAVGGIAVFFIAFLIFQSFEQRVCNDRPHVDLLREENSKLKAQIATLLDQPIVFRAESGEPELQKVILRYYDRAGELQTVKPVGNTFTIPHEKIGDADAGFYLTYADIPAERSKRPPIIGLQRIEHRINPLRISLFLRFGDASDAIQ
jgi:hypothetical protein